MQKLKAIPRVTNDYISDTFDSFLAEAYKEAEKIVTSRAAARDVIPIWEKMPFDEKSYVTFIYHKACRLVSMLLARECCTNSGKALKEQEQLEEKIDDELLDLMNYAAFTIAARRTFRKLTEEQDLQ